MRGFVTDAGPNRFIEGRASLPRERVPAVGSRSALCATLIETIYRHTPSIARWLRRAFPRACPSHIEDAMADAFADAVARPAPFVRAWQRGGEAALLRFFQTVAWRHLRGHFRKRASRCEIPMGQSLGMLLDSRDPPCTPYAIAAGRELEAMALRLLDEAAERFGGGRPQALRAALSARLCGGTDTEVARAHQVPREYVNRAKRWIGSRLALQESNL